jgi:hypothetical protein
MTNAIKLLMEWKSFDPALRDWVIQSNSFDSNIEIRIVNKIDCVYRRISNRQIIQSSADILESTVKDCISELMEGKNEFHS